MLSELAIYDGMRDVEVGRFPKKHNDYVGKAVSHFGVNRLIFFAVHSPVGSAIRLTILLIPYRFFRSPTPWLVK
jgi:hypothetical protein